MCAHIVAGTVSGIKVTIHDSDELWLSVDIEVSEWSQNLAINTGRNLEAQKFSGCGCAISDYWCDLTGLYKVTME